MPTTTTGVWTEAFPLRIRSERDAESYLLELHGELDLSCADALDGELRRAEATGAERVVVDLSRLAFIDSTGIRVLLQAEARSRQDSNRLAFNRPSGAVARVLELVGADSLFTFTE